MPHSSAFLAVDWPLPKGVGAAITLRTGGVSAGPWRSFNFADHVGDDPHDVATNRLRLHHMLELPCAPQWLRQVHGTDVVCSRAQSAAPAADGCYSRESGVACGILTADCLPVLFCDRAATVVAAAHAGWRGLAAGVLHNTVRAMDVAPENVLAFLGPAISQPYFEVGPEVLDQFVTSSWGRGETDAITTCFTETANSDRLHGDLVQLARVHLALLGVEHVYGGDHCSYANAQHFYSYRRDGVTGRTASLIWLR